MQDIYDRLSKFNLTQAERAQVEEAIDHGCTVDEAVTIVIDNGAAQDEQAMYQDLRMGAF